MTLLQLVVVHSLTIPVVFVRLPPLLQTLTALESQPLPVVPAVCFSQVLSERLQFISSQRFSLPSKDSILCSSELMDYCSGFCSASNNFGKNAATSLEIKPIREIVSLFLLFGTTSKPLRYRYVQMSGKTDLKFGTKVLSRQRFSGFTPISSLMKSPIWNSSGLCGCSGPIWSCFALKCGWIRLCVSSGSQDCGLGYSLLSL